MPSSNYTLEAVARGICAGKHYIYGGGIGQGAFKETFLATRPDKVRVALKVLRPGCCPERSDREIDAMTRCAHPNIVGLLELDSTDHDGVQYTYLVEKFMDGGTLEERLKDGLLDRNAAVALGEELIHAVAHIAEKELVHRDIKPANIMYPNAKAQAVIGDFGLVRDLTRDSITKSHLTVGPGTPFFAAPEQLNNEKSLIDWRSDQFAVGVTLAIARFGFHPYSEEADSDSDAVGKVAGRRGPARRFIEAIDGDRLPALASMVAPWPVNRIRTPEGLLDAWLQLKVG